jgi:hypothetical protein
MRKLNLDAVKNIFNSRANVTKGLVGKRVILTVQSPGTEIEVKNKEGENVMEAGTDDTLLMKKIFNCKANSAVAIANDRNREILKSANELEKSGSIDKAHDGYNDYLNKVQLSFSVLSTQSIFNKIQQGCEVAGQVQLISTENGEILTLDPKTITVQEPERVGSSSFDMAL